MEIGFLFDLLRTARRSVPTFGHIEPFGVEPGMVETVDADKDGVLVFDTVLHPSGFKVLENAVLETFRVRVNSYLFEVLVNT
jgi:hypothetical protein